MSKNILLVAFFICLGLFSKEKKEEVDSVFGSSDWNFGAVGAPILRFSQLGDGFGISVGGKGQVVIGRLLTFGGAGHFFVFESESAKIGLGYGGPGIGVKFFTDKTVHLDFFNTFGFGRVFFKNSDKKGAGIFVLEPEINLELNLLPYLQLGLGSVYRFAFGGKELGLKSENLFGFGGQFYMQFGWL